MNRRPHAPMSALFLIAAACSADAAQPGGDDSFGPKADLSAVKTQLALAVPTDGETPASFVAECEEVRCGYDVYLESEFEAVAFVARIVRADIRAAVAPITGELKAGEPLHFELTAGIYEVDAYVGCAEGDDACRKANSARLSVFEADVVADGDRIDL